MADNKPAHSRKEKRENDTEKSLKISRSRWKPIAMSAFWLIAVLQLTFWLGPQVEAWRTGPEEPAHRAPTSAGLYEGKACFSTVPHADTPQATWSTLSLPANGDSPMIAVPCPGTHPVFTNAGYEIHVVYEDASTPECVMGNPLPPCGNHGRVKGEYLRDTTGHAHDELYAYALD